MVGMAQLPEKCSSLLIIDLNRYFRLFEYFIGDHVDVIFSPPATN